MLGITAELQRGPPAGCTGGHRRKEAKGAQEGGHHIDEGGCSVAITRMGDGIV